MNDSSEDKKWERIVVDEIFNEEPIPIARLLRSKRKVDALEEDMGIDNWGDEKEDFIETRRVEAFVGYPPHRQLNEGDVFFIKDGSKLTQEYDPATLKEVSTINLLMPWEESKKLAREEIKVEFARLSVASLAVQDREHLKQLNNMVDKKFHRLKYMKTMKHKSRKSKF